MAVVGVEDRVHLAVISSTGVAALACGVCVQARADGRSLSISAIQRVEVDFAFDEHDYVIVLAVASRDTQLVQIAPNSASCKHLARITSTHRHGSLRRQARAHHYFLRRGVC